MSTSSSTGPPQTGPLCPQPRQTQREEEAGPRAPRASSTSSRARTSSSRTTRASPLRRRCVRGGEGRRLTFSLRCVPYTPPLCPHCCASTLPGRHPLPRQLCEQRRRHELVPRGVPHRPGPPACPCHPLLPLSSPPPPVIPASPCHPRRPLRPPPLAGPRGARPHRRRVHDAHVRGAAPGRGGEAQSPCPPALPCPLPAQVCPGRGARSAGAPRGSSGGRRRRAPALLPALRRRGAGATVRGWGGSEKGLEAQVRQGHVRLRAPLCALLLLLL